MTDCIFCQIIAKKLPADIKQEHEDFIVIQDLYPKAPVHWLIIPKIHIPSLNELTKEHSSLVMNTLLHFKSISNLAGLTTGYRTIVNTGKGGGQVVPHIHFHMIGGGEATGF